MPEPALWPLLDPARDIDLLRRVEVRVEIARRSERPALGAIATAILAHRELKLIALLVGLSSAAETIHLRLQIGEIGLHARNPCHQRAALGRRIGAEDQETPVVAADLARISKTALQLRVLAARRIRKAAGALGVLAVERRPLILQRHATRRLREGARAEGDRGRDEEREARHAREASVSPHPVSLLRALSRFGTND